MNDPYDGSSPLNATEQRLAAELTALADSPAPTAASDTAWAVRTGRSRLMRRRLAVLGAVTAVAVGAATLNTAWPDGRSGSTTVAAASATAGTAGLPLGPDTGRDPLVVQGTFGPLPAGFDTVVYNKGFSGQPGMSQAKAIGPKQTNATADFNRQLLFLTVYAPGVEPSLDSGGAGPRYRVDTAPVNGRPAYWVGSAPDNPAGLGSDWTLRFQTADGRWAQLQASYMSDADQVTDVVVQVAAGVRIEPQAVAMPFTINGLPAGLTRAGASLDYGPESGNNRAWEASVIFMLSDKSISLTAAPDTGPTPSPTNPFGFPVQEQPHSCRSSQGVKLCVSAMDGEAAFASIGGFAGLLDRVTSLGTDENAWTTEVIR
ncbi:hypothetical protein ABZW10_32545 [Kitasatospora sp. NPDC004723]|uniref:hypothetical protein n=1 Tax=Kitasatospora sp. NPDC004723 TaxID=3154288 RepID=UPI0033B7B751